MSFEEIFENLGEKKEEFVSRAMQCGNAEELIPLAKEYGIVIDEKQSAEFFELLKKLRCKLPDKELDGVAGGLIFRFEIKEIELKDILF